MTGRARRCRSAAKTVDHHISSILASILAKLEVRNRTEAVRKALERGLDPA